MGWLKGKLQKWLLIDLEKRVRYTEVVVAGLEGQLDAVERAKLQRDLKAAEEVVEIARPDPEEGISTIPQNPWVA